MAVPTLGPAAHALRLLTAGGRTVATAESLTGGLVAAAITDLPGSSAAYLGGVVAYATRVKHQLLGVDAELLAAVGAVHPEVAAQMAGGVRAVLGASYGVATTGVAGPAGQDGQGPGTVWIGLADEDRCWAVDASVPAPDPRDAGGRDQVRRAAVLAAWAALTAHLHPAG